MPEITIDNLWNNDIYQDQSYYDGVKQIADLIVTASNNEYIKDELSVGNDYICILKNTNNKMPSLVIIRFCTDESFDYLYSHPANNNNNNNNLSWHSMHGNYFFIGALNNAEMFKTGVMNYYNGTYASLSDLLHEHYNGIYYSLRSKRHEIDKYERDMYTKHHARLCTYRKRSFDINESVTHGSLKCFSLEENDTAHTPSKIKTYIKCFYENNTTTGGLALYFMQTHVHIGNKNNIKPQKVLGNQFCLLFGYNNNDKYDLGFRTSFSGHDNSICSSVISPENTLFAHINGDNALLTCADAENNLSTRLVQDNQNSVNKFFTHHVYLTSAYTNSTGNVIYKKIQIDSDIFKPLYLLNNNDQSLSSEKFYTLDYYKTLLSQRSHQNYIFVSGNIAVNKKYFDDI